MSGVNGKVLPGCFIKYVGGAEVRLYPVETVRRVELGPASVTNTYLKTYFTYPLHPNVRHKATMSLLHR